MAAAMDFHFSDTDFEEICRDLKDEVGFNPEALLWTLNLHCGAFVQLRPRIGKDLPTPDRAKEAWLEISRAAKRLKVAIDGLREAGAADFILIGSNADKWAASLPSVIEAAKWAAEMERYINPPVANNADPHRDGLIKILVRVWQSWRSDKRISTAENGPLMRYLVAAMTPTFTAVNEPPPSTDTLRGILRKLAASSVKE